MRCLVASWNVHHHGGWKKCALARFTQPLPYKGRSPLSYMARVPFFCRLARIAATAIRERDSAFFERRRPRARGLAASEARRRGEERGGEGEGNFAVSLTGEKMAGGRASDKRDERDGERASERLCLRCRHNMGEMDPPHATLALGGVPQKQKAFHGTCQWLNVDMRGGVTVPRYCGRDRIRSQRVEPAMISL